MSLRRLVGGRAVSWQVDAPLYVPSQYYPGVAPEYLHRGVRCENLEALSFADANVDLHVTQDVLKHVFRPVKIFKEIVRTLKPGGMHISSVPIVRKFEQSRLHAKVVDDIIQYLDT